PGLRGRPQAPSRRRGRATTPPALQKTPEYLMNGGAPKWPPTTPLTLGSAPAKPWRSSVNGGRAARRRSGRSRLRGAHAACARWQIGGAASARGHRRRRGDGGG